MADNKYISDLEKVVEVSPTDSFIVESNKVEKQVTAEQLKEYVGNVAKDGYTSMAQVTLSPNIVEGKNILTQEMVKDANTIYKIEKDFEISTDIVLEENSSLSFQGGSIKGDYDLKLNNGYIQNAYMSIDTTLSGTITNDTLEGKWFASKYKFLDSINSLQGYDVLKFEREQNYEVVKTLNIPDGVSIDGQNCTLNAQFDGVVILYKDTPFEKIGELTSDINSGDLGFVLDDVSGVKKGDVLVLRDFATSSWSTYRNYQQGEFVIVSDIDTTLNQIKGIAPKIYGNYKQTSSEVFLKRFNTIFIKNINIECKDNTKVQGLQISSVINSSISGVNVTNCTYGIIFKNGFQSTVEKCNIVTMPDFQEEGHVDVYGIVIVACQSVTVSHCYLRGGNHGISSGSGYTPSSAIINRFLHYDNIIARSDGGTFTGIDVHGDSEYTTITNCQTSGINLAGGHASVNNCNIIKTSEQNGSGIILLSERINMNVDVNNSKMVHLSIADYLNETEIVSFGDMAISNCDIGLLTTSSSKTYKTTFYINNSNVTTMNIQGDIFMTGGIVTSGLVLAPQNICNISGVNFVKKGKIDVILRNDVPSVVIQDCIFQSTDTSGKAYIQLGNPTFKITNFIVKGNTLLATESITAVYFLRCDAVTVEKLVYTVNNIFPMNVSGGTIYILGTAIRSMNNDPITKLGSTAIRMNINEDVVLLDNYMLDGNQMFDIKSNKHRGLSSLLPKSITDVTLTATDTGYQAMYQNKPVWWNGTKWIDAMGTEIVIS